MALADQSVLFINSSVTDTERMTVAKGKHFVSNGTYTQLSVNYLDHKEIFSKSMINALAK